MGKPFYPFWCSGSAVYQVRLIEGGGGGVNRFSDRRTDLALKRARIVAFCGKSSGFADFENTVRDRGSAVNFDADYIPDCACLDVQIWVSKRNLDLGW